MSQTTRRARHLARRATIPLAAAAALAAFTRAGSADTYFWDPANVPFPTWDVPGNWTPEGTPGATDDVVNNDGSLLYMGSTSRTARNATINAGGIHVTRQLSVLDTTRVERTPSAAAPPELVVFANSGVADFDTNFLELAGGEMYLYDGHARIDRAASVDGQSLIRGAGTIEFATTVTGRGATALTLDGEIRTEVAANLSTLTLRRSTDAGATGVLALGGTGSNVARINVEGGTSRLSVQMPLDGAFGGVMRIGGKNSATFLEGFDLAADGKLFLNTSADVPNSSAELLVVGGTTLSGSVRVQIGLSQIHATVTFAPTVTLSIDPGARLRLNSTTTYRGGTYTGNTGTLYQNGDAVVAVNTTMAVGTYDWDGEGENRDTTINPGAHFRISSPNLDDDASGAYDGDVTLDAGRLTVDGPAAWTLAGTMFLKGATVPVVGGSRLRLIGRISASAPALVDNAGITLLNGSRIETVGAAAVLDVNAPVGSESAAPGFFKSGAGTLAIHDVQSYALNSQFMIEGGTVRMDTNPAGASPGSGNLAVTVNNGANLELHAPSNGLRSLLVNGGGRASLKPGGNKTLMTRSLGVAGVFNPVGELDLHDNALIIDYDPGPTSPLANFSAYLKRGYNDGAWDGKVMDSGAAAADPAGTTALGIAEASDVLGISGNTTAPFMGRTVDATSILVRYTLYGDASLNGQVGFEDLVRLAQNYNAAGTRYWPQGDFNFDNKVDFGDLVRLAQNYNRSLPLPTAPLGAAGGFSDDLARAFAQVPEPSGVGFVAAAALSARRSRRRRGARTGGCGGNLT